MSYPNQYINTAQFPFTPSNFNLESIKHHTPYLHHKITTIKPIKDFLNINKINLPKTFLEWQKRIFINFNYFNSNYHVVTLIISIFLLFQNIYLLLSLIVLSIGLYLLNKFDIDEIEFQNYSIPINKNFIYLVLLIITIPIIIFSSPISTLLSLISISAGVILVHASIFDTQFETSFNESVV